MTPARPRWPALDGVRGIAALAVLLFHAQLGIAVNGYVGVDVFFALSGFLITSILLAEGRRTGGVRLRRFYVRRMLRLYPALVVTCALVVAAGAASGQLAEVGRGALAAMAYIANWWMYTGHPAPLLEHTWTLAIEEHFYAVWPVLVLGLLSRRRTVLWTTVGACLALVALLLVPWAEPIRDVQTTYLRGFPIIWGSLLAWVTTHGWAAGLAPGARVLGGPALVALLGVLLVPWTVPEGWLTGPSSVTGVLSVLVIASFVLAPGSFPARALGWSPLRWAGTRSYGMYLYHFPVLQVLRHQVDIGPEWARMLLGIAVTLIVTELSFRCVETPFLRLKDQIGRRLD